jgi:peroxiredoxin
MKEPADVSRPAPDLELPSAAGDRRSLREFLGKTVIVSFLSSANCPFCRAHVIRMVHAREEIAASGAEVILVAYHDPELLMAKMMHDVNVPYLLLLDLARDAYRRWGLRPFTFKSFLVPSLYWAVLKMALKREPSLGSAPNANQLGGDFVVDRSGNIAFARRMRSIHDRASIPQLLSAVARA